MKKQISSFLILLFLSVIVSCNTNKEKNVIEEHVLINLIADLEMAKAFLNTGLVKYDEIDEKYLFNAIYEKHNTSKEEFQKALDYYKTKEKKLENIYDKALNKLAKKKMKLEQYKGVEQ